MVSGFHTTTKFYQASTSELFGNASISPQNESTPFLPRSPYAIAKLYGYWMTCQYRDAYAVYACNGILFNHESPRRGPTFVTKKITQAVASIYFHFHFHDTHSNLHPNTHLTPTTTTTTTPPPFTATTPTRRSPTITSKSSQGLQKSYVKLGNLDAKRDWGHAKDYVVGMWLMLQQKVPQDFVLATGETHTVREFVTLAFEVVNLHIRWEGSGLNEVGIDQYGHVRVKVDAKYFRPTEVHTLLGDASKAKQHLNWQPKVTFRELIKEMVLDDLAEVQREHPMNMNRNTKNLKIDMKVNASILSEKEPFSI
ncbi:hypothetical protein HMI55_007018 [Coelomomyces lativittatus]|nr:hypothetical protein HMI55_007018 [Coelomomyces lativittatus]KAJ1514263.1 hypothetical protein HMI56_000825 [Coelomomyces lativittatus]